jgi:hypothetical protein
VQRPLLRSNLNSLKTVSMSAGPPSARISARVSTNCASPNAPTIARRKGKAAEKLPPAEVLLRVFFATDGARIILLLSGYDKLADSKPRRQNKEIERARKLLKSYRLEKKRLDKAKRG